MPRPTIRKRDRCRLCDSLNVEVAVPMRPTPIADAYVPSTGAGIDQPSYPLDLHLCRCCGHVQLLDVIEPDLLFSDYIYQTSNSPGLREHFRRYADLILHRFDVPPGSLAVDIGSNDGTLLQFFRANGLRVIGVDPAVEIAREAAAAGVETKAEFFSPSVARAIRAQHGPARIVTANNVFAHADDLSAITRGIADLLTPEGVFIFEVVYLLDLLDKKLFDTVFHEHLSYHSIGPLRRFLDAHGLELFDVERVASKGGSIRGFVAHRGGPHAVSPIVDELTELEERRGLATLDVYRRFAAEIEAAKRHLHSLLDDVAGAGAAAGFGASATVTTLMYQFELERRLAFLVDDNTMRHGLLSPGCHLPVLAPAAIGERRPKAVVILAWNYAEAILKRHVSLANGGARFVVPMPTPRLVPAAA